MSNWQPVKTAPDTLSIMDDGRVMGTITRNISGQWFIEIREPYLKTEVNSRAQALLFAKAVEQAIAAMKTTRAR